MRRLCALALLSLQLLTACAGPAGIASPAGLRVGRPLLASLEGALPEQAGAAASASEGARLGEVTPQQRAAEWSRAKAEMFSILSSRWAVGTTVVFRYWDCDGALTLDSWQQTTTGGEPGAPVAFAPFWRTPLPPLSSSAPGYLQLEWRREDGRWVILRARREASSRAPPEAKSLPVETSSVPAAAFEDLRRTAQKWLPLLHVSGNATARFTFGVDLMDGRRVDNRFPKRSTPHTDRSRPIEVPDDFDLQLAHALIPFAQGIGPSSAVLTVQPRSRSDGVLVWEVVSASVVRPFHGEPEEPFTRYTDYRLMHEEILRRWRAEVRDSAEWAATFTAEQLAWWVLGGVAIHGIGAVVEASAGPLVRVLTRSGPEAAGWLETLMARLPGTERKTLVTLWTKMEAEGLEALTQAEREELRAFFLRLDDLARSPITDKGGEKLRQIATRKFWEAFSSKDPELAKRLQEAGCEVHHRFPIEHAHLEPELNINNISQLVSVPNNVHYRINAIWSRLRTQKVSVRASDVRQVVGIIDRHFQRWYNNEEALNVTNLEAEAAKRAALDELNLLMSHMENFEK